MSELFSKMPRKRPNKFFTTDWDQTGRPPFCRLFLARTRVRFSDKFLWTKAFDWHKIESMKLAILQDCGSISA
jgi:hypothetical protein